MKLRLEYIDEETGVKVIVKNKGDIVYYHTSDVHDPREFQSLTGLMFRGTDIERNLINAFYKLAGELNK